MAKQSDEVNFPLAQVLTRKKSPRLCLPQCTTFTGHRPKQTQSFLDFGQKNFGAQVTCSICGMLFTKGQDEDEQEVRCWTSVNVALTMDSFSTASFANASARKCILQVCDTTFVIIPDSDHRMEARPCAKKV